MSSSPSPEFDPFLLDFLTSYARSVFASDPPSQDQDEEDQIVFTVYSIPVNLAKEGPLPASKFAIDGLPTVSVTEGEDCAICLSDYAVAREAKELPCKHKYHSDCIMKWLGIHGSCPVCRYEMPVDEEEKRRREGGVGWQVVVSLTRRNPVSESGRNDSDPVESNESAIEASVEDMDVDMSGNGDLNQSSMEDLD